MALYLLLKMAKFSPIYRGNELQELKMRSALQQMTDAEIDSFIVPLVLKEFAANNAFTVRGNVTAYANNSGNVGGFINRLRDDDVGDHPITASDFTTTNFSINQEKSNSAGTTDVVYPTNVYS